MVNTLNVSQYDGSPLPVSESGEHLIGGGPLYSPEDIQGVLDGGEGAIKLWTRNCIRDVQNMGMDNIEVADLINVALKKGRYTNSQWCVAKPGGVWAACDAYRLVREEWVGYAHKYMNIEYYVKFAINRSGKLILTVSCHGSRG